MKPIYVKPNTYIDFNKQINKIGPTFKVGDNVRISKYKNIFEINYMLDGKASIVNLIAGLIKKHKINEGIFSKT